MTQSSINSNFLNYRLQIKLFDDFSLVLIKSLPRRDLGDNSLSYQDLIGENNVIQSGADYSTPYNSSASNECTSTSSLNAYQAQSLNYPSRNTQTEAEMIKVWKFVEDNMPRFQLEYKKAFAMYFRKLRIFRNNFHGSGDM